MFATSIFRHNRMTFHRIVPNKLLENSLVLLQRSNFVTEREFSTTNFRCKTKTKRQKIFVYDVSKRPSAELDKSVLKPLESGKLVGRAKTPLICPPEKIVNALQHILNHNKRGVYEHLDEYLEAGIKLRNVLEGRHPPLKEKFGQKVMSTIEQKIRKQYEPMTREADENGVLYNQLDLEKEIKKRIGKEIDRYASYWKQIEYDNESAVWAYTFGKAVFDYACMHTVMMEIKRRLPPNKFQPRTLLDFGSGVGTSIWAALEVFGTMNEVFAVDTSPKMNDFARLLLQGGNEQGRLPAGYFFRLHLPRESEISYDLVTSSFTLLDLASESERLGVIDNLWRKTNQSIGNPDFRDFLQNKLYKIDCKCKKVIRTKSLRLWPLAFLILIEVGTNAGFQVLAEARHHLTSVYGATEELQDDSTDPSLKGHLFAPCPHELQCPRFHLDNIPCNFEVRHRNLYFDKLPNAAKEDVKRGKFCYLVFRKGPQSIDCSWPRLTSEPLLRHNHVVCRMCTSSGKLQEYVAVNSGEDKNKKLIYKYAKRLHWGDQVKVHLTDQADDIATSETTQSSRDQKSEPSSYCREREHEPEENSKT